MIKTILSTLVVLGLSLITSAQNPNYILKVEPASFTLEVGEKQKITAKVFDGQGNELKDRQVRFFSRKRKAVFVDSLDMVLAMLPGEYQIIAISPDPKGNRIRIDISVTVNFPPIAKIQLLNVPNKIYLGTTVEIKTKVIDKAGLERKNIAINYRSTDTNIASIDPFGNLKATGIGKTKIFAKIGDIESSIDIQTVSNPITKLTLESEILEARTGDVFHCQAKAFDKSNNEITDIPIMFTFQGKSYDVSSNASGMILQDGRFVADEAGLYTITASSGSHTEQITVKINPRNINRKVELVGKGSVNKKHTSDFWVWEGVDGRDYAVTGTWGADGTTYFWDVTNPSNLVLIDSIKVDARTVNDVKVSEDGKICVISREGASNRKNGFVIIDVENPREAKIISTFTENLTGGVHNLFIYQDHVYALSAGQKYYSVNIKDPANPYLVGKFELNTMGHSIHDVWIEDGIAYSSNWSDGVQLVDVGNGIAGGSPENPIQFASYAYPSGANHAAFPFRSKSTGKFYVVLGDEIFPYGLDLNGENIAGGFMHIIDFTDYNNPIEIARFEVPNAGSHNLWVKDDILYAAFYNGGIRIVDLSGELMGDLYRQGREIGWIIPSDPNGYIPNAPFTWGAQPYKGHVFYSDWNSGLWAAKVEPEKLKDTKVEPK